MAFKPAVSLGSCILRTPENCNTVKDEPMRNQKQVGMSTNVNALSQKIQTLSEEQINEVEDFVEFLQLRSQDRASVRSVSSVSTPAFAAVWNNQEDDAYDAL